MSNIPNHKIPYTKPSITDLEIQYATDAAANGWGEHCYDYINRFEKAFKEHLGVQYAVATSSCTGALHMGMHALGIGPGDEVIMADINWIATASPIVHLGATPVFVDILSDSWCLDPQEVESAITSKTKAIVAVHLYGNLCNMDEILSIGERYGIPVIEDAAEAVGSQFHGKRAGSMGLFGAFSFHGTKTITTGEGGMFVTNDPALYEQVLTLSNHGRARGQSKQFWPDLVGFKYKMSNIQAAIGCAQIERIDELIGMKRDIFSMYENSLKDLPISMNPQPHGCVNGYWMPTIVVHESFDFNRDSMLSFFRDQGVDVRVFFWPLSTTQVPHKCNKLNKTSLKCSANGFNLPSFHDASHQDIYYVSSLIKDFLLN